MDNPFISSPRHSQYNIVDLGDDETVDMSARPTQTNDLIDLTQMIDPDSSQSQIPQSTSPPLAPTRSAPPPPPATPPRSREPHPLTGVLTNSQGYAENPADRSLHYPPSAYAYGIPSKLIIKVSFLERVGTSITTSLAFQVATEGLTARSFSVRRTYEDFEALRHLLKTQHPGLLVPPLANKKVFESINLTAISDRDIQKKQKHLQNFLTMISQHPRLSITPELSAFLQMTHFRSTPNVIEEQFSSLEKLAGSFTRDIRHVIEQASPDLHKTEDPQLLRLLHLRELADQFEHRLSTVYRLFFDLSERSRQSAAAYNNLKSQLANLADSETNLQNFYLHLASVAGGLSLLYSSDASSEDIDFLQEFDEYLLLTADMIDVIRYNIQVVCRYHDAQREQQTARVHLDQLLEERNQPVKQKVQWIFSFGEDLDSRIEKAHARRDAVDAEVLNLRQRVEQLAHHFMDEMKLFNSWKVLGFQAMFMKHIDRKIEFHQQAISAWNSLRHDIRQVDTSLASISVGWWPQERAIAAAPQPTGSMSILPNAFASLFEPESTTKQLDQNITPSLGESTVGHQPGFSYPSLDSQEH